MARPHLSNPLALQRLVRWTILLRTKALTAIGSDRSQGEGGQTEITFHTSLCPSFAPILLVEASDDKLSLDVRAMDRDKVYSQEASAAEDEQGTAGSEMA